MGTKNNPGKHDCWSKLQPDEPYFVLMGRDKMAGQLVEMWAIGAELKLSSEIERALKAGATLEQLGEDRWFQAEHEKIAEAKRCAVAMTEHCRALGKVPMRWNAKAPVINVACDVTKEEVMPILADSPFGMYDKTQQVVERMARALRILP